MRHCPTLALLTAMMEYKEQKHDMQDWRTDVVVTRIMEKKKSIEYLRRWLTDIGLNAVYD